MGLKLLQILGNIIIEPGHTTKSTQTENNTQ